MPDDAIRTTLIVDASGLSLRRHKAIRRRFGEPEHSGLPEYGALNSRTGNAPPAKPLVMLARKLRAVPGDRKSDRLPQFVLYAAIWSGRFDETTVQQRLYGDPANR